MTKLRSIRKEKGLTLAEMAERCAVSEGYLSRFERGIIGAVEIDMARRIAKQYGVDIEFSAASHGIPKITLR